MSAIEVSAAGKRYNQLEERATLVTSLVPFLRRKRTERWALRNITFRVEPGETVGILGRNGAGKTTMLRLLAGVTRPSEGTVTIRGRVAPLISVGVGFHQEMSGRENVYVNGMLLGLTKRQIDERFDRIVEFAELEEYIDTPVKFYSSGMYMRLGFSVAAHVDPDVLLVDEVLAVGDIAFQLKCFERMRDLQGRGSTILLVSHSMHAIRLLCPRAILIRKGQLEIDGTAEEAIARHHELMSEGSEGTGRTATITHRELIGPEGPTHHPKADDPLRYIVSVRFEREVDSPQVNFQVVNEDGTLVYNLISAIGRSHLTYREGDNATITIPFAAHLGAGTYRLRITIWDRHGRHTLAHDSTGFMMYLPPEEGVGGIADLKASIRIDDLLVSDHQKLLFSTPNAPSHRDPGQLGAELGSVLETE